MNQAAKATEPSMEEILASIRRIISDDDANAKSAPAPKPVPAATLPEPPSPPPPPLREPQAIQNDMKTVLAAPPPAVVADADVLDLTEDMAAVPMAPPQPQRASSFRTIDAQPDVVFSDTPAEEPAPSEEPEPVTADAPVAYEPPVFDRTPIMSMAASQAVDQAFSQLTQTVFTQNGRTIEDLVRDMLRPMLKTWLDDNLPGLVERLVRAEIERVSRGRR
ncbi:MAG: DUF2497 domain-containing protein [Pseudorhodoplanes sp.]|nr:DUF2497 domain-containing protein [Pseudorhodoplanes sp.]GIK82453.1 MAG: hypothetical protein BroJett024_35580 [Alphaproteobacteria bacterium]